MVSVHFDSSEPSTARALSPVSHLVEAESGSETDGGGLDGDPVERTVQALQRICRLATFDFAIEVGSLIVNTFYGGNIEAWRQRGKKDTSLRRLSRHPLLPMSAVALYRSISIYEMCRRLEIPKWRHLTTSHLRTVLGIPPLDQKRLLELAERNTWTVRRLEQEVKTQREHCVCRARGGRKRSSKLNATIRTLEKCLDVSGDFIDVDNDRDTSAESIQALANVICRLKEACTTLERRLGELSAVRSSNPP
jgi:hypothetical protein